MGRDVLGDYRGIGLATLDNMQTFPPVNWTLNNQQDWAPFDRYYESHPVAADFFSFVPNSGKGLVELKQHGIYLCTLSARGPGGSSFGQLKGKIRTVDGQEDEPYSSLVEDEHAVYNTQTGSSGTDPAAPIIVQRKIITTYGSPGAYWRFGAYFIQPEAVVRTISELVLTVTPLARANVWA